MKIIDLLNRIAKGEEVPKKIKYDNQVFEYREDMLDYYCYDYDLNLMGYQKVLNEKVEILEEEKKTPEKICTNRIINTHDILEFEMIQNKINAEYTYVINSIIDYLKSKGDE